MEWGRKEGRVIGARRPANEKKKSVGWPFERPLCLYFFSFILFFFSVIQLQQNIQIFFIFSGKNKKLNNFHKFSPAPLG